MRSEDRVTPLELFFDLVFVLALTQCTALMADAPHLGGAGAGASSCSACSGGPGSATPGSPASWTPRRASCASRSSRAMAALLVVALCVPQAFGDLGLLFACAYGVVRVGADRALRGGRAATIPALRHSVTGLAVSTAIGCGPPRGGLVRRRHPPGRALGARADARHGRPLRSSTRTGWKLAPAPLRRAPRADRDHRARRVDRGDRRGRRGATWTPAWWRPPCSGSWWPRRSGGSTSTSWRSWPSDGCQTPTKGRERNEIARDSFSYLHLPMVAGIVLLALGLKKTLEHVDDPLKLVPGRGHARRHRPLPARARGLQVAQRAPVQHPAGGRCALVLVAFMPAAEELPALVTLAFASAVARGADRLRDRRTSPSCASGCGTSWQPARA